MILIIADQQIIAGHIAVCKPACGDAAAGGVAVGDDVQAVFIAAVIAQLDHRLGDLLRSLVNRGVGGKDHLQGRRIGNAGGLYADHALEQLHGLLGVGAEVAVDGAVVVVQLFKPLLQLFHAAVFVAAAQGDEAAVFGRILGEELLLQAAAGGTALLEADFRLEALHGCDGGGIVGGANLAFQVIKLLQAAVEFAHTVAGVALLQVDVAFAGLGGSGVKLLQGPGVGNAGVLQIVLILEQGYGSLGAGTKIGVRIIGQKAEIPQPFLHILHAQSPVALGEQLVGIIGRKIAFQDRALQLCVGGAVRFKAQIHLQELHCTLGAPAEDAVDVVIVVVEVFKLLLDGGNRIAAAAAPERLVAVLGRRLQKIPNRLLIGNLVGGKQNQGRGGILRDLGGEINEGKGGQDVLSGGNAAVDVQLAADGFQLIAAEHPAAQIVAVQGRQIHKMPEAIALQGVNLVIPGEHEQLLFAGGKLHLHIGKITQHHAPEAARRIIGFEGQAFFGTGEIIHRIAQHRPGLHAGIDEGSGGHAFLDYVQAAAVGEVKFIAVAAVAFAGNIAAVGYECAGNCIADVSACAFHEADDHAVCAGIDALNGLRCLQKLCTPAAFHVPEVQLVGILRGNKVDAVFICAGGLCVIGDNGFRMAFQIDADQPSFGNGIVCIRFCHKHDAVGVNGDQAFCGRGIDRGMQAGNKYVSAVIHKRRQFCAADHMAALTVASDGKCRHAHQHKNQNQNDRTDFFHGDFLLNWMVYVL